MMTAWVSRLGTVAGRGRIHLLEATCGTKYCRTNELRYFFKSYNYHIHRHSSCKNQYLHAIIFLHLLNMRSEGVKELHRRACGVKSGITREHSIRIKGRSFRC